VVGRSPVCVAFERAAITRCVGFARFRGHASVAAVLAMLAFLLAAADARAQLTIHADVEHFAWREHTEPIEVKESGPRFGIGIGYLLPKPQGFLFGAQGRLYGGGVDYEGSFQFDVTEAARGTSTYLGTTVGADLRYRWPDAIDAVAGLDYDAWRRQLSESQKEEYRILSLRLGVERDVSSSRFIVGGGMRFLLATAEEATVEDGGFLYKLDLTPGTGSNPYLHAGYRVAPRVTLLAYWDGMTMGRSNELTLVKRGRPQATVSQPPTDVDYVGLRVSYGW
jgi:hypothetical protein